jgi:hypothetical protein
MLAAVLKYAPNIQVTKELLLGFAGAGYAGADFIGGIMESWIHR